MKTSTKKEYEKPQIECHPLLDEINLFEPSIKKGIYSTSRQLESYSDFEVREHHTNTILDDEEE